MLYRRGFSRPLLKCIIKELTKYAIWEIHEGVCGSHSEGRMMTAKVLKVGYYWPTVQSDCAKYVKKCTKCQEFGPLSHLKPEALHNMISHGRSPYGKWTSLVLSVWKKDKPSSFCSGLTTSPSGSRSSLLPPSQPRMCRTSYGEALCVDSESRTLSPPTIVDSLLTEDSSLFTRTSA